MEAEEDDILIFDEAKSKSEINPNPLSRFMEKNVCGEFVKANIIVGNAVIRNHIFYSVHFGYIYLIICYFLIEY